MREARYQLTVERTELNPDNKKIVPAITVNGTLPAPEIRVREGDLFRAEVSNHLDDQPATIHWHGLLVPAAMDGVPGVSQVPIPPGEIFLYEYPLLQSGTYWYHSHYQLAEQLGLLGPFVVEAKDEPLSYDREYIVMLSDWLHSSPYDIIPQLRRSRSGPFKSMAGMALAKGMAKTGNLTRKQSPGKSKPRAEDMAIDGGPDLSDVRYDAFLLNGRSDQEPWTCVARVGERVRFRIINGSASTFFRFMIDGHALQVTHADGPAVRPVEVDNILIGTGECYDVLVTVKESASFTIRAQAQDGSAQAVGILYTPDVAPKADLGAPRWGPRQLAYDQLQTVKPMVLSDAQRRRYDLELTGDMKNYVWSINEQVYPDADPLIINSGERVEVTMRNKTRMWHPMHLHGHFFRLLIAGQNPKLSALKHTVAVPPGGTVRFEFLADNPGRWFFHCHNAYHLEAGMARQWQYMI